MAKSLADARRERLTKICSALPEATHEYHGDHAIYRIRKKTFAYYMKNHHGDGKISVAAKVATGDNAMLVAAQPHRFYMPAYIANKGWVALRLDTGPIDWDEVRELISGSYRRAAPKRLAEMVKLPE